VWSIFKIQTSDQKKLRSFQFRDPDMNIYKKMEPRNWM